MLIVRTTREPVTVPLTGAYAGATVTLRRLTTPQFNNCRSRAMAILSDKEALVQVLERNGLIESGAQLKAVIADPTFAAGYGGWLAGVECGLEAIIGWTGIETEPGRPAPIARDRYKVGGIADPLDPADLEARLVMETLFLCEGFERQVSAHIDLAARILVAEGKGSGPSQAGTAGEAPTAGGLNGAGDASRPARAAPGAEETALAGSAPA